MPNTRDVSIVMGTPPSRKHPIRLAQLNELATARPDVEIRTVKTGTGDQVDVLVVDPTGKVPGELLFYDGRLQIRDPEPPTIDWMLRLAADLGGRVVDNTLRTYRAADETYPHPDDHEARARLAKSIRSARELDRHPTRGRRSPAMVGLLVAVGIGAWWVLSRRGG